MMIEEFDKELDRRTETIPQNSQKSMNKQRIKKNIAIMCVSVFLLFTAYEGPTMLQSTMNKEQGIGVASQAIIYGCFCISALLLPKYILKKFGSKTTFVVSMIAYIPYIGANYYPHWSVMIPASILLGLGASLLWGSQSIYLNDISVMYADLCILAKDDRTYSMGEFKLHKRSVSSCKEATDSRCSGIMSNSFKIDELEVKMPTDDRQMINDLDIRGETKLSLDASSLGDKMKSFEKGCQLSTIKNSLGEEFGKAILPACKTENLPNENIKTAPYVDFAMRKRKTESITARVFGIHGMAYLSSHFFGNLMSHYILKSDVHSAEIFTNSSCVCGAKYCNAEFMCFDNKLDEVSVTTRYTLTTFCVSMAVVSVIIVVFFLDPLELKLNEDSSALQLFMATIKLTKRYKVLLLIPFSFYTGQVQGFYVGEFTKAYIGCSWGTHHVSLVSMCYGLLCALSSTSSGWLVKIIGRRSVFTAATLLNIASSIFLLLWNPDPSHPELFFIVAGMWGVYVGAIWSQLRAFYGVLFKADEEAAFAQFHLWHSLGFCLSLAYSGFFCTSSNIYILLAVSVLGYIGYSVVERKHSIKSFEN